MLLFACLCLLAWSFACMLTCLFYWLCLLVCAQRTKKGDMHACLDLGCMHAHALLLLFLFALLMHAFLLLLLLVCMVFCIILWGCHLWVDSVWQWYSGVVAQAPLPPAVLHVKWCILHRPATNQKSLGKWPHQDHHVLWFDTICFQTMCNTHCKLCASICRLRASTMPWWEDFILWEFFFSHLCMLFFTSFRNRPDFFFVWFGLGYFFACL